MACPGLLLFSIPIYIPFSPAFRSEGICHPDANAGVSVEMSDRGPKVLRKTCVHVLAKNSSNLIALQTFLGLFASHLRSPSSLETSRMRSRGLQKWIASHPAPLAGNFGRLM
jgi:hypothetical protein